MRLSARTRRVADSPGGRIDFVPTTSTSMRPVRQREDARAGKGKAACTRRDGGKNNAQARFRRRRPRARRRPRPAPPAARDTARAGRAARSGVGSCEGSWFHFPFPLAQRTDYNRTQQQPTGRAREPGIVLLKRFYALVSHGSHSFFISPQALLERADGLPFDVELEQVPEYAKDVAQEGMVNQLVRATQKGTEASLLQWRLSLCEKRVRSAGNCGKNRTHF